MGENGASPMANVLKVFLENGQTKSFKYDANTTVQDVVSSLQSKLCLCAMEHFSLVVEHIKSLRRNKLTLLDPQDTLTRVKTKFSPPLSSLTCLINYFVFDFRLLLGLVLIDCDAYSEYLLFL